MNEVKIKYSGQPIKYGGSYLSYVDYNPLHLPQYTMRVRIKDGVTPTFVKGTGTQVSSDPNVWDLTYTDPNWNMMFVTSISNYNDDVVEVLGFNADGITSMSHIFFNCRELETVCMIDTRNAPSTAYMFYGCKKLVNVPDLDTRSSTNSRQMFEDCTSLSVAPHLVTDNVTNMYAMFSGCSKLVSVPMYETGLVTDMSQMFIDCTWLQSCPTFDTHSVVNMTQMFQGTNLRVAPAFDTSSCLYMGGMFSMCARLSAVPLYNTANVQNFKSMFYQCYAITEIPLLNTSSAVTVENMFQRCQAVEHGALALYNQMSSQTTPPTTHNKCFNLCGYNTTTGLEELRQIPTSWGGYKV